MVKIIRSKKNNSHNRKKYENILTVNSKEISTIQCRSKTYFENDFPLFVCGQFNMLCRISFYHAKTLNDVSG
jgi:hypothetical protein